MVERLHRQESHILSKRHLQRLRSLISEDLASIKNSAEHAKGIKSVIKNQGFWESVVASRICLDQGIDYHSLGIRSRRTEKNGRQDICLTASNKLVYPFMIKNPEDYQLDRELTARLHLYSQRYLASRSRTAA